MASIVLAHGILGYGDSRKGRESRYFNGVASAFRRRHHDVLVPTVDLLGSLDRRARQLAAAIENSWPDRENIIVIAHSMGGLDIRRVVATTALARRIDAIATIATPHLGSPVADAVLDRSHPLRPRIPGWLLSALGEEGGAISDLRTRAAPHDGDVEGIRYLEVGCDCGSLRSKSPLFTLAQSISGLASGGNDGVVPLSSAKHPDRDLSQTWFVDHGGAIGWPSGRFGIQSIWAALRPPREHLARYAALLDVLLPQP